jgi:hypothetical protein
MSTNGKRVLALPKLMGHAKVRLTLHGQLVACTPDQQPVYLQVGEEENPCVMAFEKAADLFAFYRRLKIKVDKVMSIRDTKAFIDDHKERGIDILCNASFDGDEMLYMKFEHQIDEADMPALGPTN